MVSLLCLTLGLILLFSSCFLPWLSYHAQKQDREFQEFYRHFKLRAVQQYYEELKPLSLREIESRYDVDSIYQRLGF